MKNHIIMQELLPFIAEARDGDDTLSFVEIILEFAEVKDIDIQRVQEAIQEDTYFKKLLMNDCVAKKIIKTDKDGLDEW